MQLKKLIQILQIAEEQNPEMEVLIRNEVEVWKNTNGQRSVKGIHEISDIKMLCGKKGTESEEVQVIAICFEDQKQFKKLIDGN